MRIWNVINLSVCLFFVLQVAHELDLILQEEGRSDAFEQSWETYCRAIVSYAQASKSKSKELKHALRDVCEGEYYCYLCMAIAICILTAALCTYYVHHAFSSIEEETITGLRCLAYYLHTKTKKKTEDSCTKVDIPFLVMEVPVCCLRGVCVHVLGFQVFRCHDRHSTYSCSSLIPRLYATHKGRRKPGYEATSVAEHYKILPIITCCTYMTTLGHWMIIYCMKWWWSYACFSAFFSLQRGTPVSEVVDQSNNHPHIVFRWWCCCAVLRGDWTGPTGGMQKFDKCTIHHASCSFRF